MLTMTPPRKDREMTSRKVYGIRRYRLDGRTNTGSPISLFLTEGAAVAQASLLSEVQGGPAWEVLRPGEISLLVTKRTGQNAVLR